MSDYEGRRQRKATEVTTRMPAELRERLRAAAKLQGVTMNAFMLESLRARLDGEGIIIAADLDQRIERRAKELTLRLASQLLDLHLVSGTSGEVRHPA